MEMLFVYSSTVCTVWTLIEARLGHFSSRNNGIYKQQDDVDACIQTEADFWIL